MSIVEWPVDWACLPDPCADDATVTAGEVNSAAALATDVLWALSGRRYGLWLTTHRPCAPPPLCGRSRCGDLLYRDYPTFGRSMGGCGCCVGCNPAAARTADLPGPVAEVVSVSIADRLLDECEYRLEGNLLYRIGADWPGQDFNRPLPEPCTWSVTYRRGIEPPAGVDRLTAVLAKEFLLACGDKGKCRLPRTVVSTTQRGVTHSFDPAKLLASGRTGIPEIDLFLAAVNPHGLTAAPVVL